MNHNQARIISGFTLVELLMAITILAIIAAAAAFLLSTCLQTEAQALTQSSLQREGTLLMDRLVAHVKNSPCLLIPNNGNLTTRTLMATYGYVNDDNDYYFGDTRFPRVDEDPTDDWNKDGKSGIKNIDDDGDNLADGGLVNDDDEDAHVDEDPNDALDNDSDGNIDEDSGADLNADGAAGIKDMDDDGDGTVDESVGGSGLNNDDEDTQIDEDPIDPLIIAYDGANTLTQKQMPEGVSETLSTSVAAFAVGFERRLTTRAPRVLITFRLTRNGETRRFAEYVYLRNILERNGKRVM